MAAALLVLRVNLLLDLPSLKPPLSLLNDRLDHGVCLDVPQQNGANLDQVAEVRPLHKLLLLLLLLFQDPQLLAKLILTVVVLELQGGALDDKKHIAGRFIQADNLLVHLESHRPCNLHNVMAKTRREIVKLAAPAQEELIDLLVC